MISALKHYFHLLSSLYWDAEKIQHMLDLRLKEVVKTVHSSVPIYRELYSHVKVDEINSETLSKFPVLTKDMVKSSFPDGLLNETVSTESLYRISTSGTADRIMTFHDSTKRNWDRAADIYMILHGDQFFPGRKSIRIPPDACYEFCGEDDVEHFALFRNKLRAWFKSTSSKARKRVGRQLRSLFMRDFVWRTRVLRSLGVEGAGTSPDVLDHYWKEISSWKPSVVQGVPITLYTLARHRVMAGLPPYACRVPVVRPAGGKMTDRMRAIVEAGFQGGFRENYGTGELGSIAMDCQRSRWLHLFPDLFHLEFVRNKRPVRPYELGEILITDLRNLAAPMIRYQVGDVGRFTQERCECGFQGLRFIVDGRLDETLVSPTGVVVSGSGIVDVFLEHPAVVLVRVLQKLDDLFVVEYMPDSLHEDGLTQEEAEMLLSRELEHPVRVDLREVKRIAPERSGKFKLVHSLSHNRIRDPEAPLIHSAQGLVAAV